MPPSVDRRPGSDPGSASARAPRLQYLPPTSDIQVGDRIVTSGHGGVFPVGLPVGVVTAIGEEGVRVMPYADAMNMEYVRLMDFGLDGILDDATDEATAAGDVRRETRRRLRP